MDMSGIRMNCAYGDLGSDHLHQSRLPTALVSTVPERAPGITKPFVVFIRKITNRNVVSIRSDHKRIDLGCISNLIADQTTFIDRPLRSGPSTI